MNTVVSKAGTSIQLTDERWLHSISEHNELAELHEEVLAAVAEPQRVLAGGGGELLAVREVEVGK